MNYPWFSENKKKPTAQMPWQNYQKILELKSISLFFDGECQAQQGSTLKNKQY